MSEQNLSIYKALAAAQAEVRNPPEETMGQYGPYASLQSVLDTLRPIWSKHGLAVVQHPLENQLVTDIYHESGGHIQIMYPLMVQEISKGQNPSHRMGSAMTYARRYSLNAIFGTQGDIDSDDNPENEKKAAIAAKASAAVSKAERAKPAAQSDLAAYAAEYAKTEQNNLAFTSDPLYDEWVAECAKTPDWDADKVRMWALKNPEQASQKFTEWKGAPVD